MAAQERRGKADACTPNPVMPEKKKGTPVIRRLISYKGGILLVGWQGPHKGNRSKVPNFPQSKKRRCRSRYRFEGISGEKTEERGGKRKVGTDGLRKGVYPDSKIITHGEKEKDPYLPDPDEGGEGGRRRRERPLTLSRVEERGGGK